MEEQLRIYDTQATASYSKVAKEITGKHKGQNYKINVETGKITVQEGVIPVELSTMMSCSDEKGGNASF